jgi:hypothetical protein
MGSGKRLARHTTQREKHHEQTYRTSGPEYPHGRLLEVWVPLTGAAIYNAAGRFFYRMPGVIATYVPD